MEGIARRVVAYDDIARTDGSDPSTTAEGEKVNGGGGGGAHGNARTGKQPHWTADGRPISATAARQYRRTLQLLASGQITEAETLLQRMDTAKLNNEIQQALAWAKRKHMPVIPAEGMDDEENESDEEEDDGSAEDDIEGEGEGEEEDDEEEEEEEEESQAIAYQVGDTIDLHTMLGDNAQQPGTKLTHAEIWDDSALVDAWDAAMEEYKMFDAQRTAHMLHAEAKGHSGIDGSAKKRTRTDSGAERLAKRSALWHDAPEVGSAEAIEARALATEAAKVADREQVELERRKREARAMLAQLPGEKSATNGLLSDANTAIDSSTRSRKRRVKGVKPPSSHIPGNPAWHSACAVVSQTPNAIGDDSLKDAQETPTLEGEHATTTGIASSTPAEGGQGDVLQNMAMAWYYAGYYQAMASVQMNRSS